MFIICKYIIIFSEQKKGRCEMKDCFNEENALCRTEMDRKLRAYRALGSLLRSSGTYGRNFGTLADGCVDEVAIQSQMYAVRSLILSLSEPKERFLLYNYYIKGLTLEKCAKLLGVSRRTVYRLKNRALDSAMAAAELKVKLNNGKC